MENQISGGAGNGIFKDSNYTELSQVSKISSNYFKELQRQPFEAKEELEDEELTPSESGMPKRKNSNQSSSSSQTLSVQIPKNGGSLLSQNTRTFFETRFNHDFSQVRIHTGSQSAKAAQQINANAFTVGSNIYFNKAQYDTSSLEGMKLLAHELTHVIQQDDNLTLRRNICRSGNCPQGQGTEVINEDCRRHTPSGRFISRLDVVRNSSLSQVYATWSDGTRQGPWNATTHPSNTPLRPESSADRVGLQCSIRHTNQDGDKMAWFTGFHSQNKAIGFHNSQPVARGRRSHGCVRVCCDKARIINQNTKSVTGRDWQNATAIVVTESAPSSSIRATRDSQTYTVKSGDTLSGIADEHNVSLNALRSANRGVIRHPGEVNGDIIHPGDVLIIP